MGEIIFILGGARSGKSRYTLKIAKRLSKRVAFIATCITKDPEMKRRIKLHKKRRPPHWKTFEVALEPISLLKTFDSKFDVVIIDCLTLMISNLMLEGFKESVIRNKIVEMLTILKKVKLQSIIVSNEVGLGIVPENKLARDFRDITGKMNQLVAEKADRVFFMFSGIPLEIK